MAYFKNNEPDPEEFYSAEENADEVYDDGFDELTEEPVPEFSEEELRERRSSRARMVLGAGNLFGVIAGTVLILILLTLIFSIVHFIINDMGRNLSLFQTNF